LTLEQISRYINLLGRLERAEELLFSLQQAVKPASQSADVNLTYGIATSPGTGDKVGILIAEIEDLKERIKYLKSTIVREKKKINKFIDEILDERVRVALRYKYICGATWFQTAEVFGENYTEEKVKKMCYSYLENASDTNGSKTTP